MAMPGRRTNYSLLSQFPDDQPPQQSKLAMATASAAPFYESLSLEKNKVKNDRPYDWQIDSNSTDHRRVGSHFSASGLQRQSSGSSFGESSISGEYYVPTIPASVNDPDLLFSPLFPGEDGLKSVDGRLEAVDATCSSSSKSWAQQTEESYQLQLALALRLSSEATCADDPNLFCPATENSLIGSQTNSAESVSHRFWVNGCLSYYDKVPDGFYLIRGIIPYVWTMCTDILEGGRLPSIESLRAVDPNEPSLEVVLIDSRTDPGLKELENKVVSISHSCIAMTDLVEHLSKLVCNLMGGSTSTGESDLECHLKDCVEMLKGCLHSIVLPVGRLSAGLCRHRALLFKVLADTIDLPCRVAKGCKYCKREDASSCLVRFDNDKEYLVDLIGNPGILYEPDSLLNGPLSISISSPLRMPKFKSAEIGENLKSLAKQYFLDCHSLNIILDDTSAGYNFDEADITTEAPLSKDSDGKFANVKILNGMENSQRQKQSQQRYVLPVGSTEGAQAQMQLNPLQNSLFQDPLLPRHFEQHLHREIPRIQEISNARTNKSNETRILESGVPAILDNDLSLEVDDVHISWNDLVLKERIGAGSFGTVHRADWLGSEVAVKILMEQDFLTERIKEFQSEVAIMKRLRHPNIVLFMGAVTRPPNLSIVTEYLSRGSLYRLLHRPGAREMLDDRRRLNMAYDVAKGMNYLHKRNPPIVHRDLKSPNLLVDKKYTVKVCDFGLSKLKEKTFLSSKTSAGTPEWMAPEVLRDEPSNEKSDIYSFGVILWELMTLLQPWSHLNAAQVVAAVGFKNKRLDIPSDVNPQVSAIIESCWENDPRIRPSFSSIMESLKTLMKSLAPPGHG